MIVRALFPLLAGFLLVAWGCGTGGAGEPGGPGAADPMAGAIEGQEEQPDYEDLDEEDLPLWARDLEAGDPPPQDTEYSGEAETALVQADLAGEDDPQGRESALREALAAAERGIEADPENPMHYFLAGQAAMFLDEYELAAEYFDEAEERHPQYRLDTELMREEAWIELYNEGVDLLEEDQEDSAIEMFERAHRVYQQRPESMLNLATLYHERDELDRAAEFYGQAIEVIEGPRSEDLEEEERERWEQQLEPARFNRAQINMETGNYAEAAEDYEVVLERDPDNNMALSNLSIAYMRMGEDERAREIYDELFAQEGLMMHELLMIGVGFFEGEDWEQAAEAFRRIIGDVPDHRDAHANLVQTFHEAERWEELQDIGDRALELDSHNPVVYQLVAQGYVNTDDQQTAVEYLNQMEALPFWLLQLHLEPHHGQGAVVHGQFQNQDLDPGSQVEILFTFYGPNGNEIGTETANISAPAPEEATPLQVEFSHSDEVAGYSYEVISP